LRLTLKQTKWWAWYHHKKECHNYVTLIITKQTQSGRNDITLWKRITTVATTTLKKLSGSFYNNIHPNRVKITSIFPLHKPRSYSPHGESLVMVTEEGGQFSSSTFLGQTHHLCYTIQNPVHYILQAGPVFICKNNTKEVLMPNLKLFYKVDTPLNSIFYMLTRTQETQSVSKRIFRIFILKHMAAKEVLWKCSNTNVTTFNK
jgi:hypothetical protein